MTFQEKLQIISEIYFDKSRPPFPEEEIVSVENRLQLSLPGPMKEFYRVFGECSDLFKCMYDIAAPGELYVEDKIFIVAKENQNVCAYGIHMDTQRPVYLDNGNKIMEPLNHNMEDFLIYLLAIQGTGYLPCIGKISVENKCRLEKTFLKISKADGDGSVFCRRNGIIGVVCGSNILLSARDDEWLDNLEQESGLQIDFL